LIGALAIFVSPVALAETVTGQTSILDGDTLEMHGQRIRLSGIDATESSQPVAATAGIGRESTRISTAGR
jgi:endonuclease YncB( thermonuclease family)